MDNKKATFNKIKIEPLGNVFAQLYIDGTPIKGVQNIEVKYGVNTIPTLIVELISNDVNVAEIEAMVHKDFITLECACERRASQAYIEELDEYNNAQ